jgi:hypothetical protein
MSKGVTFGIIGAVLLIIVIVVAVMMMPAAPAASSDSASASPSYDSAPMGGSAPSASSPMDLLAKWNIQEGDYAGIDVKIFDENDPAKCAQLVEDFYNANPSERNSPGRFFVINTLEKQCWLKKNREGNVMLNPYRRTYYQW